MIYTGFLCIQVLIDHQISHQLWIFIGISKGICGQHFPKKYVSLIIGCQFFSFIGFLSYNRLKRLSISFFFGKAWQSCSAAPDHCQTCDQNKPCHYNGTSHPPRRSTWTNRILSPNFPPDLKEGKLQISKQNQFWGIHVWNFQGKCVYVYIYIIYIYDYILYKCIMYLSFRFYLFVTFAWSIFRCHSEHPDLDMWWMWPGARGRAIISWHMRQSDISQT